MYNSTTSSHLCRPETLETPGVGPPHQSFYRYSQRVSSKVWLEATCFCLSDLLHNHQFLLSDLLPITCSPHTHTNGHFSSQASSLPCTHARKYSVVVTFRLSHQHHSREGHSDTLCSYPFSAAAGRQKQRKPTLSSKVRGLMGLPLNFFSR